MYYSSKTVISQYVSVNSNRTFLLFPPLRYNVLATEDFAMKDEFITRVGVWGQQYLRHIRQQAKPVIYLGFSPKREQAFFHFGHKKSKPPLFGGG